MILGTKSRVLSGFLAVVLLSGITLAFTSLGQNGFLIASLLSNTDSSDGQWNASVDDFNSSILNMSNMGEFFNLSFGASNTNGTRVAESGSGGGSSSSGSGGSSGNYAGVSYNNSLICNDTDGDGVCVQLISPEKSEVLTEGEMYDIKWLQTNVSEISLGYTRCSSCGEWINFNIPVNPLESEGSYLWNVSVVPAAYGANLSFFITGANSALGKIDTDKSDNSFVVELPAIRGLLCNDTDGGINYYTKGTLVLNNTEVRTDICLNSTRGALMPRNTEIGKGISLNSTRGTLMEYYCGFNTSADYLFFDCPHGCLDGACINASVLPDENYKKLAPSNLTATSISDSIIVLNWSDNSPNEEEFRIERFTDENGGWTEIARVSSNTEHYTDYGLKQRVNYYYRVFAYTSGNYLLNGEPSNLANATTFASSGNASNEGNKSNDEGAYLELLSPNGGEELAAGQIFNITWKQKGIHNISIGYSSQSLFEWIARGVESNASFERGAYLWNVKVAPWAIEKDIRLIIEGFNNSILYSDNSNGNFTIHNSTRTQSALK